MQRIVKVFAVAVLVAMVLVISSTAAFGRPLRGGVPMQGEKQDDHLCAKKLDEQHPRFAETAPKSAEPGDPPTEAACWHTSPGLERNS